MNMLCVFVCTCAYRNRRCSWRKRAARAVRMRFTSTYAQARTLGTSHTQQHQATTTTTNTNGFYLFRTFGYRHSTHTTRLMHKQAHKYVYTYICMRFANAAPRPLAQQLCHTRRRRCRRRARARGSTVDSVKYVHFCKTPCGCYVYVRFTD